MTDSIADKLREWCDTTSNYWKGQPEAQGYRLALLKVRISWPKRIQKELDAKDKRIAELEAEVNDLMWPDEEATDA